MFEPRVIVMDAKPHSSFVLTGEMSVSEWRHWRKCIKALIRNPKRLHSDERGFLRGQLHRLGTRPVDAEVAQPPTPYAIARIKKIERRLQ